jgi:hypothetical protein
MPPFRFCFQAKLGLFGSVKAPMPELKFGPKPKVG